MLFIDLEFSGGASAPLFLATTGPLSWSRIKVRRSLSRKGTIENRVLPENLSRFQCLSVSGGGRCARHPLSVLGSGSLPSSCCVTADRRVLGDRRLPAVVSLGSKSESERRPSGSTETDDTHPFRKIEPHFRKLVDRTANGCGCIRLLRSTRLRP